MPQVLAETSQPTDEPSEGIDTSPTIFRPCILYTHDQHVSQLCKNHGGIWNESLHGRGLVSTTDYRGTVTSPSLCNSYTIPYLTSGPPGCYHLFTLHCFCFHSGPVENQVGKPHLQFGRASSHQCDATAGVGSIDCWMC